MLSHQQFPQIITHFIHFKLTIYTPNSNETEKKIFLIHGFNKETGKQLINGYWSSESYSLRRSILYKMFIYCDICESYITDDVFLFSG